MCWKSVYLAWPKIYIRWIFHLKLSQWELNIAMSTQLFKAIFRVIVFFRLWWTDCHKKSVVLKYSFNRMTVSFHLTLSYFYYYMWMVICGQFWKKTRSNQSTSLALYNISLEVIIFSWGRCGGHIEIRLIVWVEWQKLSFNSFQAEMGAEGECSDWLVFGVF